MRSFHVTEKYIRARERTWLYQASLRNFARIRAASGTSFREIRTPSRAGYVRIRNRQRARTRAREEQVANPGVSRIRFRATLSGLLQGAAKKHLGVFPFTSLVVKSREYAFSPSRTSCRSTIVVTR